MLLDIFLARCPQCRKGPVFEGLYRMYAVCPNCGLKFEREQGYFLGSMAVMFAVSAVTLIPLILFMGLRGMETGAVIGIPCAIVVLLNPLYFRYSRLIWMYVDRELNKKSWGN